MKVEVMNRSAAKKYARTPNTETSIIVSINDVSDIPNDIKIGHVKRVLSVFFDDVCSGQPYAITEDDAKQIVEFVERYKDSVDKIIVHCAAGVSRSAATAAAILKFYTGDDSQIFDALRYRPNMSVYTKVLQAFMEKSE